LQEDLKLEIRDSVRIYLYGYDSGWMIDAPVVDVHSLAPQRIAGFIFVAHSHGGLLVKEALVIDTLEEV
jgi:hypothetical protein